MPELHPEAPKTTVSEGLAQGPYMATRAGVKYMTLQIKGVDSTNVPHSPTPNPKNKPYFSISVAKTFKTNTFGEPVVSRLMARKYIKTGLIADYEIT